MPYLDVNHLSICSLECEFYLVLFFTLTLVFHLLESHLWVFYFLSYKTKCKNNLKRTDSVLFYTLFEFVVEKKYILLYRNLLYCLFTK